MIVNYLNNGGVQKCTREEIERVLGLSLKEMGQNADVEIIINEEVSEETKAKIEKHFENGDFSEASHRDCDGDTGILNILKAYHDCGFQGYIRPDHGRHLWGEKAGTVRPGYGLYDRALGIMYMLGVWDSLEKFDKA